MNIFICSQHNSLMLIAVWQSLKTLIKPISFRVFLVFMYLNVYVSYLCLSTSHFFSIILHSIVFCFVLLFISIITSFFHILF